MTRPLAGAAAGLALLVTTPASAAFLRRRDRRDRPFDGEHDPLTTIGQIRTARGFAIQEALRTEDGATASFEVTFSLEEDLVWRIEAF
jgi:hypothetical protein